MSEWDVWYDYGSPILPSLRRREFPPFEIMNSIFKLGPCKWLDGGWVFDGLHVAEAEPGKSSDADFRMERVDGDRGDGTSEATGAVPTTDESDGSYAWIMPVGVAGMLVVIGLVALLVIRKRRSALPAAEPSTRVVTSPPDERKKKAAPAPAISSNGVFVSYRRSDTTDVTGRLYDRLVGRFGRETIFKDVDSVPLGVDFRERIAEAINRSAVILAVIGPHWRGQGPDGDRLSSEADVVRFEIETALEAKTPVIPILVNEADLPERSSLPESLQSLVHLNAATLRADPDFDRDIERIIHGIDSYRELAAVAH